MPTQKPECPSCGENGRQVSSITVRAMVKDEAQNGFVGEFYFCSTAACEVVYFGFPGQCVCKQADIRVDVFQKSTDPNCLVCYCLKHSVQSIYEEVRSSGHSKAPEQISELCRQGLDRCAETNPQGGCCLGNVRKVIRQAQSISSSAMEKHSEQCGDSCEPTKKM